MTELLAPSPYPSPWLITLVTQGSGSGSSVLAQTGIANRSWHSASEPRPGFRIRPHLALQTATTSHLCLACRLDTS